MGKPETVAPQDSPEDQPMTDAEWSAAPRVPKAEVARLLGRPAMAEDERKQRVTMYLDRDVIEQLKKGGRGWQTRANGALRKVLGL